MKTLGIAALCLVLLSSCGPNMAAVARELRQDTATVCLSVNTVYGSGQVSRTNIANGDVSCSKDGLTVKSQASQIGVPITVTPQISVGEPTKAP